MDDAATTKTHLYELWSQGVHPGWTLAQMTKGERVVTLRVRVGKTIRRLAWLADTGRPVRGRSIVSLLQLGWVRFVEREELYGVVEITDEGRAALAVEHSILEVAL